MKITFLGTSSGAPSRYRNVSSIALQLPQQATTWLFDCGEGTQHQILRSPLRPSQLERIFITHLHGDHVFGLMGLLASRALQGGGTSPITIYGPAGLAEYVRRTMDLTHTYPSFPIEVKTVAPGVIYEDSKFQVICAPVLHRIPAFGYAVIEKAQAGRFDVEKAQELGIPAGPVYGKLKKGEVVTLEDGRVIDGKELTEPPRAGRKVVFAGDTTYCPNTVKLAENADVLVHEATYLEEDHLLAERSAHSTTLMAAKVANEANVRALILTHFSSRYEAEGGSRMAELLAETQTQFQNTFIAYDFWTYEVPRS